MNIFMKAWSTKEQQTLTRLSERFDIAALAFILNRSYDSVRLKFQELGITSKFNHKGKGKQRQFYAEDVANMFELRCMGFDLADIAKCFNSNARTISIIMSKARGNGISRFPYRNQP
jgi:hypothetical protein